MKTKLSLISKWALSTLIIIVMGTFAHAEEQAYKNPLRCNPNALSNGSVDTANPSVGPDEVEDGSGQATIPGPDAINDEYPSRNTGSSSNWDGSCGAGGAFSSDF